MPHLATPDTIRFGLLMDHLTEALSIEMTFALNDPTGTAFLDPPATALILFSDAAGALLPQI